MTGKTKTKNVRKTGRKGRPEIIIDMALLKKLARIDATHDEVADFFGVSRQAITAKLETEPYKTEWAKGKAEALLSIRRYMMRECQKGNSRVLVHLSKARLKNIETVHNEHTGKDGAALPPAAVIYLPNNGR